MKVARTLPLLAGLFALNLCAPTAARAAPVLHEAARLAAAPISNTLALLGMGLLVVLGALILRRR